MMPHHLKLDQILVLSTFVLVYLSLILPCNADDGASTGGFDVLLRMPSFVIDGENAIHSWEKVALELQNLNTTSTNNSMLPLAEQRTHRIDPSNDFRYYEDGWDVTNLHYIQSLIFSGMPLFAAAMAWFCTVGLSFIIIICCYCCGGCKNKQKLNYSRKAHQVSLTFLIFFLIMAFAGGVILYFGLGNFQTSTTQVLGFLVRKAYAIFGIVQDMIADLSAAKKMVVGNYSLPDEVKISIEQAEKLINHTANLPKLQTQSFTKETDMFIEAISMSLLSITCAMLFFAIAGFIISFCGWQVVIYIFLFLGWILVTCTFIMSGISLIVQNGVGDTCVAIEDWLQHPKNITTLSKLLPCMDKGAAQEMWRTCRNTSYQIVALSNEFVQNVANKDVPQASMNNFFYNQSGPYMPPICNPFYPNLTERACLPLEVELKYAPQAYQKFVCNPSPSGMCTSMGRLLPDHYNQMMVATNTSDTLSRNGPFLVSVADCSFVEETFGEISKKRCPQLRLFSSMVFIGMFLVIVAIMFSVVLWVVLVRERRFLLSSQNFKTTHDGVL